MKKFFIVIFSVIAFAILSFIYFQTTEYTVTNTETFSVNSKLFDNYIEKLHLTHTSFIDLNDSNFNHYVTYDDKIRFEQNLDVLNGVRIEFNESFFTHAVEQLKPSLNDNSIVIYPIFTSAAYAEPGFYTYFRGECDQSCITDLSFENAIFETTSSGVTTQILYHAGYDFLTDIEVDKNPEILKNYDTVILLHNEYVTQKMFDAITSHPNLIFLSPNALYAEIDVNYDDNTMTLIRGHHYPPPENPANGFGYAIEEEFHDYEYDAKCDNWEFIEIENGFHLNCYTDAIIFEKLDILLKLKDLT